MKDYLAKAYLFDKNVRMYAASTTNLVSKAQKLQYSWPTSTAALGRALTAGAMMGSMYKNDESITIRINGGGPIGTIMVYANGKGIVRGYIDNPEIFFEYNEGPLKNHLNVKDAVGTNGFIHVTKDLKMRDVFTSSSEIISGELAEDFTYYFAKSEQIPSAVGLGVLVDTDNSVKSAGGFIIQVMPNCSEEIITKLEEKINNLKPASQMIMEGYTPEDMIKEIDDNYEILETLDLAFECNCSKEKFKRSLSTLDKEGILEIIKEDKKAECVCNFCNKKYLFNEDELLEIANKK